MKKKWREGQGEKNQSNTVQVQKNQLENRNQNLLQQ